MLIGKPGSSDPMSLTTFGPLVLADVGFEPAYNNIGVPRPQMTGVIALIDTGASISCIDDELATHLDLPIVDRRQMAGVLGSGLVDMYLAQIVVRLSAKTAILLGPFAGLTLYHAATLSFRVLLGREFLQDFIMRYDGPEGEVTIL